MDRLSEQALTAFIATEDTALSITEFPPPREAEPPMAAVVAVMQQLPGAVLSLDERLTAALDSVRPMLASHGGDVELVRVEPPAIEVRFLGACDGCGASAMTFHAGVKQAVLDACPEITNVVQLPSSQDDQGVVRVSPFARVKLYSWHDATELTEIANGGTCLLTIGGRPLLFARQGQTVTCFDNACAHRGYPMYGGEVKAGVITCSRHGLRFDLATGVCLSVPTVVLKGHPVRVTGTRVEVKLQR